MENKQEISQEEVKSFLEAQVHQAKYDLEHNLLPQLGDSQAKRLLIAIASYPQVDTDFSDDSDAMIKAFSALKICNDSQVALGTELVLQQMYQEQLEKMQSQSNEKEGSNE